jgi:alkylation response protein AidB-like acyl-CoA dehydrogenase
MSLDLRVAPEAVQVFESLEQLLERGGGLALRRDLEQEGHSISRDLWLEIGRLGFGALNTADRFGGANAGVSVAIHAHRAVGRFLAPAPLLTGGLIVPSLIGGERPDIARSMTSGETIAAARLDSLFGPLPSGQAMRVDNGRITGQLMAVPDVTAADWLLVACSESRGCLVDPRSAGVTIRPVVDLRGAGTADVVLDEVAVICHVSLAQSSLEAETRVCMSAYMVGGAHECLRLSVAYANQRRQFDRPIGAFQAIQHRLADVAIAVEGADLMVSRAAWYLDEDQAHSSAATIAAWRSATAAFVFASRVAIQVYGGYGFSTETEPHFYYRAAKSLEVSLGPDHGVSTTEAVGMAEALTDASL